MTTPPPQPFKSLVQMNHPHASLRRAIAKPAESTLVYTTHQARQEVHEKDWRSHLLLLHHNVASSFHYILLQLTKFGLFFFIYTTKSFRVGWALISLLVVGSGKPFVKFLAPRFFSELHRHE